MKTRKVVKPFGLRAELNKEANVCTMLPTTSLDDSDVTHMTVTIAQAYSMTIADSTFLNPRYHGSTLQNYVYPNPRSPSIDASQETEASKINLDRSTENPRPNYARACLAMPREKHMDTSISADQSELFEAPSDINASPRIKASTESPFPEESKQNPKPASYMKGRYIVPTAPRAQESSR
jgi:hypothetical protein